MQRRWRIWGARLLAAGVIATALAYIPYRVGRSDGYTHLATLERQRANLTRENEALVRKNKSLRAEVARLAEDPEALATVARDELGMVGPGEIVIRVVEAPLDPTEGGTRTP